MSTSAILHLIFLKGKAHLCASVRNESIEYALLEGKVDLCLSGLKNLFNCICSLWWTTSQLGASTMQALHEFNQQNDTNAYTDNEIITTYLSANSALSILGIVQSE